MRLPGVTTITGELGWNKQVLVGWANRLGLQGIDSRSFVDDKAAIGTLGHAFVLEHHGGPKVETSDYSKNQIDQAQNCLKSYWAWEQGKEIKPVLMEAPLVSEIHKFGGIPDNLALVNGKLTLLDYKTGKGIYEEYYIQVAGGYLILLEEAGYKVEDVMILNIPRSDDESFQTKNIAPALWPACKAIFLNCLENYYMKKLLKGE